MILSDAAIRELLGSGELSIEPLEDYMIQPASIDLRLGKHYLKVDENDCEIIRLDQPVRYIEMEREEVVIPPLSFMLATTLEYIKLPGYLTAFVEGRSSIGRVGLFVQNAGWVDPGFEGELTLELFNANRQPIRLQSGRRICQLVVARMDRAAQSPYRGKYMGQRRPVGSRIYQDPDQR